MTRRRRRRTGRIRRYVFAPTGDLRGMPIHAREFLPPTWPEMCRPRSGR